MKNRLILVFILYLSLSFTGFSQETWSLQRCVDYAKANNITLTLAQYAVENEALTLLENKHARYPFLSGNIAGGVQFGKTIDPTTNSFDNQTIGYNSFSINTGIPVYQGGRITHAIKQSEYNLQASKADLAYQANQISLSIAAVYLQILLAEEQLANAENRLKQTQRQLESTNILIQAGSLAKSANLDVLAQIARDEQNIVEIQNIVSSGYLRLKTLLELEPDYNLSIEKPEIAISEIPNPMDYTFNTTYNQALNTQPQITADEYKIKSAEEGYLIAKSLLYPTVSLSANIRSNWSSVSQKIDGYTNIIKEQNILLNGSPATIGFPSQIPIITDKAYVNQITDNFGQGIGVNIGIPIYNNYKSKTSIQRAALNKLNSELRAKQTKQTLKTEVQKAIADMRAAKKAYDAGLRTLKATKTAFENAEKRFKLGAISTFDFTTAKDKYEMAQVDLTRTKYQYLYNIKVVEFYQGKGVKF